MSESQPLSRLFEEKAKAVSAVVSTVTSLEQALPHAVDLCDKKDACQILVSGCELPLPATGEVLCETKQQKILAAPGLEPKLFAKLKDLAAERGILCIDEGMRQRIGGVDIAFTIADFGIAETGTLVFDSDSEEQRLVTMIAEFHLAVLPVSKIREKSFDLEEELLALLRKNPSYTAFVTGASRTEDIERVLALGVHGPLELHILLLED